jgi:alcohol dehydrogenase (cytochrome c)
MKSMIAAAAFFLVSGSAFAQTLDELKNDGKNADNVLTYGMGYYQQRYSPLAQINKSNVKRLVPVWSLGLENELGEQAQPLVYDGVMYVSNARWTVAIDAVSGKQLWRTAVDFDPATPRVVCCGVSNKGVALYNGKVFRTTLHAFVVALDQKTGKEIWRQKAAEWTEGYSQTVAPLIANGVLVTGISGAEFGIRGFLDGWDPDTGKHLWRRYTTAGPEDKGYDTWEPDISTAAAMLVTGSCDPQLDHVGTATAAVESGRRRATTSTSPRSSRCGRKPERYGITRRRQRIYDWDAVWEITRRHRDRRAVAQSRDADEPQRISVRSRPSAAS